MGPILIGHVKNGYSWFRTTRDYYLPDPIMVPQPIHTTVEQANARAERFQTENKWDILLKQVRIF